MSRTRAASAVIPRRLAGTPRRRRLAAALVAVPLLASCAAGQDAQTRLVNSGIDGTNRTVGELAVRLAHIDIDDPVEAEEGMVFASFYNAGATDDRLLEVTSPAGEVELSGPVDLPSLQRVDLLPPSTTRAASTAEEETVAIVATEGLRRGTTVALTLVFERAGTLELVVPVQITQERPEGEEEYLNVIERAAEEEGEE